MADLPPIVQNAVNEGKVDASGFRSYQSDGDIAMDSFLSDMPFVGNYFGAQASLEAQNKEMAFQEYMMDKGNKFNEYMYDKNNEYNTPANQVGRLIAAGLNPAAAAQSVAGIQTASAPTSASSPSAPSLNPEVAKVAAEIEKTNAEAEKAKVETSELPRVNDAVIREANSKAGLNDQEREQRAELFGTLKQTNIQQLENLKKDFEILTKQLEVLKFNVRSAAARAKIDEFEAKAADNGVAINSNPWNNVLNNLSQFGQREFVVDAINDLMDVLGAPSVQEQEKTVTNRYIERHSDKNFLNKQILSPEQRKKLKNEYDDIIELMSTKNFDSVSRKRYLDRLIEIENLLK